MVEGAEGAPAVVDEGMAVVGEEEVVVIVDEGQGATAAVGEDDEGVLMVGEVDDKEMVIEEGETLQWVPLLISTGKRFGTQRRSIGVTSLSTTGEACHGTLVSHGTTKTYRQYGRNPPKKAGMGATLPMCSLHLTSRNGRELGMKCTPAAADRKGGGRRVTQRLGPSL